MLQTKWFCSYTIFVNTGKLIHVLLAAFLCYGQLIANIHAVGHFDTSTGEKYNHSAFHDNARIIHHIDSGAVHNADGYHSHATELGHSDSEIDCSIYHIYLNQVSVFCSSGPTHTAVVPFSPDYLKTLTHIATFSVQNQHIRGPPIVA